MKKLLNIYSIVISNIYDFKSIKQLRLKQKWKFPGRIPISAPVIDKEVQIKDYINLVKEN